MQEGDLSRRQREILDFIVHTVQERGYPPTVREIGEAVGLASPSTVHTHLRTLEGKGYLRRDPTKPRAIEVRWEGGGGRREPGIRKRNVRVRALPVYGSIAAGPSSLAQQSLEDMIGVPEDFVDGTPHFVLKVKGDSMVGAGILEGDLAVVRAQPDARDGEIVVAQVEGPTGEAEATIKRLRRERGSLFLVPENPSMRPIEAPGDLRILGKLVAILRRL